jgi:hypothetical protein
MQVAGGLVRGLARSAEWSSADRMAFKPRPEFRAVPHLLRSFERFYGFGNRRIFTRQRT